MIVILKNWRPFAAPLSFPSVKPMRYSKTNLLFILIIVAALLLIIWVAMMSNKRIRKMEDRIEVAPKLQ